MELIEDIKIFLDPSLACSSLLMISNGSKKAKSLNAQPCIENTFIHSGKWRLPSLSETDKLIASADSSFMQGSSIGLVKVPNEIINKLNNHEILKSNKIHSPILLEQLKESDQYFEFIESIKFFLDKMGSDTNTNFLALGIETNLVGLESVSFDTENKCYVGLHVDDWDKLPIFKRSNSRSLFCLNLGKEPRFIMYVNLGFNKMCQMLSTGSEAKDFSKYTPDSLVYKFLNSFPQYPIVRLKIRPTEAYIFPIQNVIHEGTTTEKKEIDLNFMALGYLNYTSSIFL